MKEILTQILVGIVAFGTMACIVAGIESVTMVALVAGIVVSGVIVVSEVRKHGKV